MMIYEVLTKTKLANDKLFKNENTDLNRNKDYKMCYVG